MGDQEAESSLILIPRLGSGPAPIVRARNQPEEEASSVRKGPPRAGMCSSNCLQCRPKESHPAFYLATMQRGKGSLWHFSGQLDIGSESILRRGDQGLTVAPC